MMATKIFDLTGKRVYVAGHRGMVGSAIVRRLMAYGYEVITAGHEQVDLVPRNVAQTPRQFEAHRDGMAGAHVSARGTNADLFRIHNSRLLRALKRCFGCELLPEFRGPTTLNLR